MKADITMIRVFFQVVLKRLNDNGKQIPTRDEVAEILNQITVTAEEDDIVNI